MIAQQRPKQTQRGIALVLVLWMTTFLAVIAASFAFSMRTDTLLAQNQVGSARAQALADAGVHRALYDMFRPDSGKQRWKPDGAPRQWEYGGGKITVTILDTAGKIDLNTASDALLKGLLKSSGGLDEAGSSKLLDAILDWRDPDDLRRINGAEVADYQAAGLKYKPANVPFETIEELQRVLGMTPELYAGLADALTTDSRQAGINAMIASKKVLLALPGVDETMVDTYLALRQEALAANLPPPPFAAAGLMAGANASVYSVRAEAVLPDGATFIRETVVKTNQGATRKLAFLSWKEGEAAPRMRAGGEKSPVTDGK